MNDQELNEALKRAAVPERGADYWQRFPGWIMAEIERRTAAAQPETGLDTSLRAVTESGAGVSPVTPGVSPAVAGSRARRPSGRRDARPTSWTELLWPFVRKPAFALGVAAACLALGFVFGLWRAQRSPGSDPQFAEARKYFQEIQALFPHQLQAIVFDQQGAHLVLARKADVPASPPLYLKICGPGGCQRFVTFSGQEIRINGEVCEVLSDHEGNVLVVGRQSLWASTPTGARSGQYQVEARVLESLL